MSDPLSLKKFSECLKFNDYSLLGKKHAKKCFEEAQKCFPIFSNTEPPTTWIDFCSLVYYHLTGLDIIDLEGTPSECKEEATNMVLKELASGFNDNHDDEEIVKTSIRKPSLSLTDKYFAGTPENRKKNVIPRKNETIEYKSYSRTLDKIENENRMIPIAIPDRCGKIIYGSGMTLNFGDGNIKKFSYSLSSPCDWDNREKLFFALNSYCDGCIKDEYAYINKKRLRCSEKHFNVDDVLHDVFYEKGNFNIPSEDMIFSIFFEDHRTISMGNYENCRYHLGLEVFTNVKDFKDTQSSVYSWVEEKLNELEKNCKERIKKIKQVQATS